MKLTFMDNSTYRSYHNKPTESGTLNYFGVCKIRKEKLWNFIIVLYVIDIIYMMFIKKLSTSVLLLLSGNCKVIEVRLKGFLLWKVENKN